jgi:hypothetical protein
MNEKVMGFVARFRNDPKSKGMDEYVGEKSLGDGGRIRSEGLLTYNISHDYIFETIEAGKFYHEKVLKGVTPKGHLEIDFPRVVKHTQVVVEIVR